MSDPALPHFAGATVALLESRLADQTAAMVRRLGGTPLSAPSVDEADVDHDEAVAGFAAALEAAPGCVVVFLTGVAVSRLFATADRLGLADSLIASLRKAEIVARGPKPTGALARRGLSVARTVSEPFTTAEVIETLATIDVEGRDVTVVHYGERSDAIVSALLARDAHVHELMLYQWRLPADVGPLTRAVDAIIDGRVDVVAFTSQIQVRHLLEVAGDSRRERLIDSLNAHVLIGSVGPTCAAACVDAGMRRVVTPEHPKLAPMLNTLAAAYAARTTEIHPKKESL
jgi:uroporphyrinogen-III synthase